ncbi:hypothetical protein HN51_026312 [Arachis hypogaea]
MKPEPSHNSNHPAQPALSLSLNSHNHGANNRSPSLAPDDDSDNCKWRRSIFDPQGLNDVSESTTTANGNEASLT